MPSEVEWSGVEWSGVEQCGARVSERAEKRMNEEI